MMLSLPYLGQVAQVQHKISPVTRKWGMSKNVPQSIILEISGSMEA